MAQIRNPEMIRRETLDSRGACHRAALCADRGRALQNDGCRKLGNKNPSRMQIECQLGFALGLGLVLGGIFLRVGLAGLDLVVAVQHRPRRRLFFLRYRVHHKPALAGEIPDFRFGGIGLRDPRRAGAGAGAGRLFRAGSLQFGKRLRPFRQTRQLEEAHPGGQGPHRSRRQRSRLRPTPALHSRPPGKSRSTGRHRMCPRCRF